MNSSWQKSLAGWFVVLGGLTNCHQEPALPATIIPFGCRVSQVEYTDTTSRVIYQYQYDPAGNRTASSDNRGARVFTFDANREYVVSQQVSGATLTYQYDNAPKRIIRIAGGSVIYDYTYEGANLKSYTAKEGSTTTVYVFSGGKLTDVTTNSGETIVVRDGKIGQRTDARGNVISYTYDSQGQLTQIDYRYPAIGERKQIVYTYDSKRFYTNTGLYLRGFPVLADKGQPGPGLDEVGGPVQVNNYQTVTTKLYKTVSGTETLVSDKTLAYRHTYNQENYSLGYARTDGARARFYYTNCN